jgi:hypothetical protein
MRREVAVNKTAGVAALAILHELLPKYFKQPKYDEKQAEAEDKPD